MFHLFTMDQAYLVTASASLRRGVKMEKRSANAMTDGHSDGTTGDINTVSLVAAALTLFPLLFVLNIRDTGAADDSNSQVTLKSQAACSVKFKYCTKTHG